MIRFKITRVVLDRTNRDSLSLKCD